MRTADPVTVSYASIRDKTVDLSGEIRRAYGPGALGILVVTGVPEVAELRAALLPQAKALASLPASDLAEIEHKASHYSVGWSHGKEKMSQGRPDLGKGSFYANPVHDDPSHGDAALVGAFPTFCTPNVWPGKLPGLREAFRRYAGLIVDVQKDIAARLDKYIADELRSEGVANPPSDVISSKIEDRACTGRLLYYFPKSDGDSKDGWCGYHNDHGVITGLSKAMFFDPSGAEAPCPDTSAGLYIHSRDGEPLRVSVPDGCLAFQMGEAAQVYSGGILRATPHYVRGPSSEHSAWSRAQLAVFSGPRWDEPMKQVEGRTPEQALEGATADALPKGVPALETRWKPDGMTFGQFGELTIERYHAEN